MTFLWSQALNFHFCDVIDFCDFELHGLSSPFQEELM